MSANDLQQSLLNSIELLSQTAVSQDNAVKSIKATIVDIKDEGLNTYTVSYGGNQFEASATSLNVKYQTGDVVYVLIPDGDFSQKKLIMGAVIARAAMYSSSDQTNPYRVISDNLLKTSDNLNLKSWKDETVPISIEDFGLALSEYLQGYKTVLFSAKIRTDIDKDHQMKGNYGLILTLPFKRIISNGETEEVEKSLVMDVNTIQGNPYAFTSEQMVSLYFDIESNLIYDNNRRPELVKFVNGFDYLEPKSTEEDDYDIFIRDAAVQVVESLPESANDGYHLSIVSTKGNFFLSGNTTETMKTLTPVLKLDGGETAVDTWSCYWFVEDASIKENSDGYLALAGYGWKCLNNKTNIAYDSTGKQTFQYITNKYTYAVYAQDVVSLLKYKCILTQDDVVVSATIEIKNLNAGIETSIVSASGSTVFPENTGYVNLISRIYYPNVTTINDSSVSIVTEWQRFDKDGFYLDNDFFTRVRVNDPNIVTDIQSNNKQVWENEIKYPCSLLDQSNLIKCTFYSVTTNNGDTIKKNLGTAQITITTSENLGYRIVIENEDVIYKYDADGDSPLIADYDGPISSKIKNILPIKYRMFKNDGVELSDEDYRFCHYQYKIPQNSMIMAKDSSEWTLVDDYYYFEGYGKQDLNYTISPTYSKIKNNNTIILTLEYAGNVVQTPININFIKDGESGTNGSKYATLIKYNNFAYGERDAQNHIRKLQLVYLNGSGWKIYDIENETLKDFDSPSFDIEVYKDGLLQNSSTYTVSWEMFDSIADSINGSKTCLAIDASSGQLSISENWTDASVIYTNVIQAKVKITQSNTTYDEELYAYYPIEVTRIDDNDYTNALVPTLEGGFTEVLYAADGTNPAYDNTTPFVFTNNILDDLNSESYYVYSWEVSDNLKKNNTEDRENKIIPVSKFDNGKSRNYIKAVLSRTVDQQQSLDEKIAEIEDDIDSIDKEIAYYEEVKQYGLDKIRNFSYNNYISSLSNSQLLLLYIKQGIDIVKDLNNLKDDILNYYNDNIGYFNIDLNSQVNEAINKVNQEKEYLHNLIKGGNLSDLAGLQNALLVIEQSQVSDISIYYQIKSMIDRWNQLINIKYSTIYQALTRQEGETYVFQSQVDNLKNNVYDSLNTYVNSDLSTLIQPIGGREPDQEFINLKNNIENIVNRLNDVDNINSYSDIQERVLYAIQSLLVIYFDVDYQENYYTNKLEDLNNNKENLEKEEEGCSKADMPNVQDIVIHIKPVIMLYNRYELSNINGWDGNKLYTNSDNESYLLAPQVGAGKKNNDNTFTGIVIGNRKITRTGNTDVGLFGYNHGQQSIFLDAQTGNAIFGSGNNTIEITPISSLIHFGDNNGKIYSGNHSSLNNENNGFYLSNDGLSIGSAFKVEADGTTTLGSSSGGAITIRPGEEPKIYTSNHTYLNSNNDGFYLSSDGLSIGYGFKVNEKGLLSLGGEDGKIVIDPGNQTRQTKFYSDDHDDYDDTDDGFYLAPDGLSIGRYFRVDEEGNLTATSGTFSGSLNGATGTFGGALNAATGTFSGDLSAAGGTFTGTLSADCLNGGTINGNYISVINLDASNITSGTIDSARIDTNTLTIYTESGAYKTILEDGDIKFYYNNSWSGYIRSIASGGLEIVPNGNIQLGQGYGHYVVIYGTLMNTAGQYYAYTTESTGIPRTGEITANYYSGTGNAIDFYNAHSTTPSGDPAVNSSQRAATVQYVDSKVSDFNLKYNIQDLFDIQNQYLRLRPVSFVYKDGVKETELGLHYGLIAQDVEDINQNLVYSMDSYPGSMIEKYCGSKFLNLKYEDLHAWHIQMIQKQHKEIAQLKQDIIYLKGELDIIKQKIGG